LWSASTRLRATVTDAFAPLWLRGRLQRAEREAERIFEMSPALLAVAGFDGYLKRFNPAFEVFGYSRDELLSRPWIEFAHPADRERMLQASASLERGVDTIELTNRVVCRDGSLRWVEWSTRVVPEEGLFYAAGRDVTESRRNAEEQAALRRVATLVARETAPEALFAAVVREVGGVLEVDAAHIGRFDPDGTVVSVAQWGYATIPYGARFRLDGDSVSARVLRTGRPARMDGYEGASGAIADTIRQIGIRFAIGAPIYLHERPWGVMTVTSKGPKPFPAESESRLEGFTALIATAIANAATRAELKASRARIVAASDEARRRIERDLHDGVQQQLVSLGLELRAIEAALPPDHELRVPLAQTKTHLAGALDDLVEISRGIHPAILSKGGLVPALKTLARRSAVPVELELGSDRRLPEQVEVAGYYVVSEALTNVAKHARASVVHVEVNADDSNVQLSIRDDGVGGADLSQGSGLVGLGDRVEALGGKVDVHSPSGEGTALVATLPLEVPERRTQRAWAR
jgi:PAS domain S-box-containing protein